MEQAVQDPHYHRPWGSRIKSSLKARWPGYPLVISLLIVSWVVGHSVQGRDRFFVERDPTLSYPYRLDTVPSWSLAFIGGVGPITIIIFTQVLIRRSPRGIFFDKRTKDIHLALIVLAEVLSVTWLITNILKAYVGRLRPDFFAYCDYKGYRNAVNTGDLTAYLASTTPGQPGDYNNCNLDILDAQLSFPSGHSSVSFCGLTFLTLFLLHVTARIEFRHHAVGKTIRFFIVLIPLFSGAIVASTRIIDYKHNVEDTIWGSLIGILGAFLAFHANYAYARTNVPGIPVTGGELQSVFSVAPYLNQSNMQNQASSSNNTTPPETPRAVDEPAQVTQVEVVPTTRVNSPGKITVHSPLVTRAQQNRGTDDNV